jgi:hydrogenase maturation protease
MKKDTLILGVGNMLLGDEGVGVHVAQRLQQMPLPPEVEVVDGGTIGYELLSYVYGKRKVIIADALNADAKPGSVIRLPPEEIDMENPRSLFVHQSGLHELLHFAQQLEPLPEIILVGIVPKSLRCWTSKLSTPVEERMGTILQAIMEELTTSVPHLSQPVDQAGRRGSASIQEISFRD